MLENVHCQVPLTTRRGGFANVLAGKERQKREALIRLQALDASPQPLQGNDLNAHNGLQQHHPPQHLQQKQVLTPDARFTGPPTVTLNHNDTNGTSSAGANDGSSSDNAAISSQMSSSPVNSPRFNSPQDNKGTTGNALHRELYNVNDALGILCSVVNDQQSPYQPGPNDPLVHLPPLAHMKSKGQQGTFLPPIVSPHVPRGECFANTLLAKKGIISISQIESLVEFFFTYFEPFLPFVHQQFMKRSRLAEQPFLLTTICSISAKYTSDANLRVLQSRLWDMCQKLLAEIPWKLECDSGSDDQVAAAILGILLLCEWHLDCLDNIEQYNRASWIHVGTAVRLAQWSGILTRNKPVFIALHWLETVIGCRVGLQPALHDPSPSAQISQELMLEDKARLNVLRLLQLAYRTLYSSRELTRESVEKGSYLTTLQLLHPQFERWLNDFTSISHDHSSWQARSVMFEFHHCRLYVYSLALAQQNHRHGIAGVSAIIESQKYHRYAIDSAVEIVNFETDSRNPVGLQLGPPMRWIVRFIHAAVFLAKTLLCPPVVHPTETPESLCAVICKAAKAIGDVGSENFQLMGPYVKMMNHIKDHVMENMRTNSSPTTGGSGNSPLRRGSASQQQSISSSPIPNNTPQLSALPVDGKEQPYNCWDVFDDSGLLAGVDNAMLYMPTQTDIDCDGIANLERGFFD